MADLHSIRKNKITLEDYDFRQDIENRLLMAQFTSTDLRVLEEILYSSIKIPLRKLAKSVDLEEDTILPILDKLSKTGLFAVEADCILVDKEMRKYFEAQIMKFDPEFKPNMEFLQSLLRKVPIHILPVWYAVPRTSNNIFESLIEKYLLTPQIFHRYLEELNFSDPVLTGIVRDVFESKDLKVYGKDLIEKYALSREQFEHSLLLLEFHFACYLGYEKVGDEWTEIVTPLHEWSQYASFLQSTQAPSIAAADSIKRNRTQDFAYILDLGQILSQAKKQPLSLSEDKHKRLLPTNQAAMSALAAKMEDLNEEDPAFADYIHKLILKLCQLKLAGIVDNRLYALESASDFLEMRPENRSLFLYRHPLNRFFSSQIPAEIMTDRNLREAEKSILRVLNSGWVYFEDFIRGVTTSLGEDSIIMLKRQGKSWQYALPSYTQEELALIKATVLEWLFELGVTATGKQNDLECFCVTSFGQSLFGR